MNGIVSMTNQLPRDANNAPVIGGYDPVTHQIVPLLASSVTTDSTTNIVYGVLSNSNTDIGALITVTGATTNQTSTDQINVQYRGLKIVLNMTTVGTGSVTLSLRGKDLASGQYYTIFTGNNVTTNSINVYTIYPGVVGVTGVSAGDILPRTWNVLVTANNANATTYTVGASLEI